MTIGRNILIFCNYFRDFSLLKKKKKEKNEFPCEEPQFSTADVERSETSYFDVRNNFRQRTCFFHIYFSQPFGQTTLAGYDRKKTTMVGMIWFGLVWGLTSPSTF